MLINTFLRVCASAVIALIMMVFCRPVLSQELSQEPIQPLPEKLDYDERKAKYGKKLFLDKRLSADNSTSCASCHELSAWGADKKSISQGIKNLKGTRNSPTIYNSALNFKQFWDGRADNLDKQVGHVVLNPVEFGMESWGDLIAKLKKDDYYLNNAKTFFGKELDKFVISEAISEFEKTLLTPNSPFDKYLKGDKDAISAKEKQGYDFFKSYGCISCHQGANVGGNMFQKFGVLKDVSAKGSLAHDLGRFNFTRNEWDKRVFKVPSLRLAVKTPPYFHNGSIKTIEEAVDVMIQLQLGREVPQEHRDAIVAFLNSLVGKKTQGGL